MAQEDLKRLLGSAKASLSLQSGLLLSAYESIEGKASCAVFLQASPLKWRFFLATPCPLRENLLVLSGKAALSQMVSVIEATPSLILLPTVHVACRLGFRRPN